MKREMILGIDIEQLLLEISNILKALKFFKLKDERKNIEILK